MSLAEEAHCYWKPKRPSDQFLKSSHIYDNPLSEEWAFQLNGNLTSIDAQNHGAGHYYIKPTAKGSSRQFNGNLSNTELPKDFFFPQSPDEKPKGLSAMANEGPSGAETHAKCHGQKSFDAIHRRFLGKFA